jgi:hypothetical protein
MWLDNWHLLGALVERFGFRIVYDSHSSKLDAKLNSVLKNGVWCWRPAHSENLVEIQSKLLEVQLGLVDKPISSIARSGTFVSADTWNHLRRTKNVVRVWHPYAIPKQAFFFAEMQCLGPSYGLE